MRTIKCYFLTCKETIEIEADVYDIPGSASTLAPGAVFGHATYARVPFAWRDEHRLSGKPWTCAFHDAMVGATLGLTDHEEKQRQSLVTQIRIGRMTKRENGWYEQAPPVPVPQRIVREDDGSIRRDGLMMRWWSQEEMIAALTPEPTPEAAGYTVTIKDPPPGAKRDAEDFEL